MDLTCLVSTVQAGSIMVWGMFSWYTLGLLIPTHHWLNATAYLSIVADHVHPFMATMYPSSNGYFQHDNALCHRAKVKLVSWTWEWVQCSSVAFPVTRFESNRPALGCGRTGETWMRHWQICRNCGMQSCQHGTEFQRNVFNSLVDLVESMPWRIEAVLRANGGLTQY